MATNDILAFCATTTGSNLLTQSEYASDPERPIGNQPGVARSKLVNKAIRQSAWMAAMLAKFLSDRTGDDVLDNQVVADLQATMVKAWPAHPALQFYQGYHDNAANWNLTSNTYADFTPSGTAALFQRQASGLTVTTAASDLPGITFTPANANAIYGITANCTMALTNTVGNNAAAGLQLTDGTTVITESNDIYKSAQIGLLMVGMPMQGIFVPGTSSPVTVKVQGKVGGDPGYSLGLQYVSAAVNWTVVRIK